MRQGGTIMPKVICGFVGGDTLIDKVIEGFSGAQTEDISHAFIVLFGRPYESEGIKEPDAPYPGVWFSRRDKYADNKHVKYVAVEVPDVEVLKDRAFELLGTLYGYTDCIATGIKLLTGTDVLIDGSKTMMCSETITRLLRAGGLDIRPDLAADQVSPVALYHELMYNFSGELVEQP